MGRITLLVVDDIEMNRSIVKKMFDDNYMVLEAANGVDAMKIIESIPIQIVVTDIFMEPMNGYELIQSIRSREEYRKIPIIAITESDQASRKEALKAGADDLIYRPFISTILHNRVNGLLYDEMDLNKYRLAYENNPIPFLLYRVINRPDTPSYKIMYLNGAAQRAFSPTFIEDLHHTDENPEHRDFLLSALNSGEAQRKTCFDSELHKWVDWTIYPEGNGLVIAMAHDITEQIDEQTQTVQKDAEKAVRAKNELNQIISNIPCGIFVFRIEGDNFTIIEANPTGCKALDIDIQKVVGVDETTALSFIHPEDLVTVMEAIKKLSVPEENTSYRCRIYNRKKKEYVWFAAQGNSKQMPDKKVYAFINFVDVTTENKLIETQSELMAAQKANMAKTEFLSRMSHDMRTPMNGILGMIELMQDKDDLDEIKKDLEQIKLSGHFLLNLLNDTLDISKIESGKMELHEKPANSVEIMKNILVNAQMMASGKGVQLKVIVPPIPENQWKPIIVDSARLEQIMINIISNAIKYTPEKEIVEVEMKTVSVTETEVIDRYVVRDTGIGISEEFLPHIFEPFSQEGRIYTRSQNGTGIGLSIVKQLVDMMGGEIKVTSKIDKGTVVTLLMKYKVYEGSLQQKASTPLEILRGKRVLLCEDHPLNAQIATKLLEKYGMKIDLASDGSIGVKMYESAADSYYDVILMDIRMPVMDGIEAAGEIRRTGKKDAKKIPIIAMTANAFEEDIEKCRQAGMNAHLTKPITPSVLYETIVEKLQDSYMEGRTE